MKQEYWKQGYASEAAIALASYAFDKLNLGSIIFEIRPENTPSIKVAKTLGATVTDEFIKNVKGK